MRKKHDSYGSHLTDHMLVDGIYSYYSAHISFAFSKQLSGVWS